MEIQSMQITLKDGTQAELRSARKSDAEGMLNHLRTTHRESYRNLNQPPSFWENFSVEAEEKILSDFEASATNFLLVAVVSGTIVGGLGMFGMQGDFLKHNASLGMSIQQRVSGSGLGTAMMKYALESARVAGYKRISLTVRTFNEPGIKLYEKVGFKKIGLLTAAAFIDGSYVDEYSYELLLS